MSRPVGDLSADPAPEAPPERPFANAPASSLVGTSLSRGSKPGWAWLEATFWLSAAACALLVGLTYADRAVFSARQSTALDKGILAGKTPVTMNRPTSAAPARPFVARLEIPAIALSALVVDGVDETTLLRAVGRIPESSRPGEPGDVALAGHRDTDFRALGRLGKGDRLMLRTLEGEFDYEVESIRIVEPHRVDVLTPEDYPTLTLVTCYPFRYVGRAPMRYVVRARQVAGPQPATAQL